MTELPDWIFGELIRDLGEFLGEPGLTVELCEERSRQASAEAEVAMGEGTSQDEWWAGQSIYLYNLARHHVVNEQRWRELYAQFPVSDPGGWLLDYGCGIGTHTFAFSALGWNEAHAKSAAMGTDLSAKAVEFAKWRARKRDSQACFTDQPDSRLDALHDLVFMHDVVGHLTAPRAMLSGIVHRIVVPGGRLYLTYNNHCPTSEGALHRNAEIDFPALLQELGMQRESEFVWRRPG